MKKLFRAIIELCKSIFYFKTVFYEKRCLSFYLYNTNEQSVDDFNILYFTHNEMDINSDSPDYRAIIKEGVHIEAGFEDNKIKDSVYYETLFELSLNPKIITDFKINVGIINDKESLAYWSLNNITVNIVKGNFRKFKKEENSIVFFNENNYFMSLFSDAFLKFDNYLYPFQQKIHFKLNDECKIIIKKLPPKKPIKLELFYFQKKITIYRSIFKNRVV